MSGYYLMHRGWQDNAVFRREAFSRRDAFVWLIENASYRPQRVHMPKGETTLDRGQLGHSLRFMASAWRWDESKVRRFLSSLQSADIIALANDTGQSIITICNYDFYQASPKDDDAPIAAATPQQRRSDDAKKKEGNEGNELPLAKAKGSRAVALPPDFEPILTEAPSKIVAGWPPGMFERELAQFKDRAIAKGETFKDWQAAFRTWVSNADKWRNRDGRQSQPASQHGVTVRAAIGFLEDVRSSRFDPGDA